MVSNAVRRGRRKTEEPSTEFDLRSTEQRILGIKYRFLIFENIHFQNDSIKQSKEKSRLFYDQYRPI